MEITKLNLKNFRTHRNLELFFREGITGIIGDNGSGKSSVVEAISFLLTGEGYGAKADMLTVGEFSGYVTGHLKIAGKEAILERHLDSAKVAFKYDGVTYKKAGEVAEVWEQLFQIDKNIFKNIVIAKQGETSSLFSGDNATKEKIFQKIFLVPNTTKIRDTIWNKYIKTTPPEYPSLNEEEYLKELVTLESHVDEKRLHLSRFPENLDTKVVTSSSRLEYLRKCQASATQREQVLHKLTTLKTQQQTYEHEIVSIEAKLATIDYHQINASLQQLAANKPHHEQKTGLEVQLRELQHKLTALDTSGLANLEALIDKEVEARMNLSSVREEWLKISSKIADFRSKGLVDVSTCPYCGTELKDMAAYMTHLELKLPGLEQALKEQQEGLTELEKTCKFLRIAKASEQELLQRISQTVSNLEVLEDVRFDLPEYELYRTVIAQYEALDDKKANLVSVLHTLNNQALNLNVELATIPAYDNSTGSLEVEVLQVEQALLEIKRSIAEKREVELQLAKDEQSLELTQKIFDDNKKTKVKNEKRNRYLYLLNELYELFHTSQFPRKLIQTYAGTVSEYLNEHLRLFNFPYTAKVNDNFGIDVFDSAGLKLPAVSGGQEVMIGVALRLSLHNMFGAAFPMMILDEGSVHLSSESKKSYFEIIKNLKKISNFKQVIIVDHDDDLASVVDNTIKL